MPKTLREEILRMNQDRSQMFCDTTAERRAYRREHPTEIMASMCMDGRVNLRIICGLLFGLVTPLRNIGGRYKLGWPMLVRTLLEWERYTYSKRRPALFVITYHWSEGDRHRGCAGFKYDRDAALDYMLKFKEHVDRRYHGRIATVVMGVETDTDALVIHGKDPTMTLDMREWASQLAAGRNAQLASGFLDTALPDLPKQVRHDLVPLLLGNARHVVQVREQHRQPNEFKHCERVLAVGQGFDWLDRPNLALIIGPCDPNLGEPIVTAANIIRSNLKEGRIPSDGGVLLVSSPYRDHQDRDPMEEEAIELAKVALHHIHRELPDMGDFFHPLVGVLSYETRRFEPVEFRP